MGILAADNVTLELIFPAGPQMLDAAIAAMETLAWKDVEDGGAVLISSLCRCLRALAAACYAAEAAASAALLHAPDHAVRSDGEEDEDEALAVDGQETTSMPG